MCSTPFPIEGSIGMAKNIVICCDGTGNEFGNRNSNVVKLFTVLALEDPKLQVAYYDPGIGTMGSTNALSKAAKWFTKVLGLAFGYGLLENVGDAYRFLMQNWEKDDRLFLFGFSRGAYTARVLASMLHMFGLLPRNNEQLIPYLLRSLKRMDNEGEQLAFKFKDVFSIECKPHFVGVWDTVSSVGWITDPLTVRYSKNNPDIHIGRHAISIDERRCFFRQNLWGEPQPGQDYKQVWFAGVHSDIGGGYLEEQSGLAKVTLQWMIAEAKAAGLNVAQEAVDDVLGRTAQRQYAPVNPYAMMHDSMCGAWKILEYVPRRHWKPGLPPPGYEWILYRKRPRSVPENSLLHQAVLDRKNETKMGYNPPNLPKEYGVEPWGAESIAAEA
jgi:uncharacterized protein (DUF2235 family)